MVSNVIETQLRAAFAHHRTGDLAAARRLYEAVLDADPNHPEALHLLGVLYHQNGQQDRAQHLIARAIAINPRDAKYHNNLGEVLRADGDVAAATAAYRAAIEVQPEFADAHGNLGIVLRQQGDFEAAIVAFEKALNLTPEFREAAMNLASTYRDNGNIVAAVAVLERLDNANPESPEVGIALAMVLAEGNRAPQAIARLQQLCGRHPRSPDVYTALGDVQGASGFEAKATRAYKAALAIDSDHPGALYGLGSQQVANGDLSGALHSFQRLATLTDDEPMVFFRLADVHLMLGQLSAAESATRAAIKLAPEHGEYHNLLGWILREDGRLDESNATIQHALELQPDSAEFLDNQARTYRAQGDIRAALALLGEALDRVPDSGQAHDNLGKTLVAGGDAEAAIVHFRRALDLQPNLAGAAENLARARKFTPADTHDIERVQRVLESTTLSAPARATAHFALAKIRDDCDQAQAAFEQYAMANELDSGHMHFDPDRHGRAIDRVIATFSEEFFAARQAYGVASQQPVFVVGMLRSGTTLVEQILASHAAVHGAGELSVIQGIRSAARREDATGLGYVGEIQSLDRINARALAENYLQILGKGAGHALRVTDKMPTNFLHLGLIALLFPNARVVHCTRGAMDVCVSIYFQHLTQLNPYSTDLLHIGRYYFDYQRLMTHWREVLPLRMLEVSYEALVEDQEQVSRALIEFLGLEWDAGCLDFFRNPRAVLTASDWQVRQPIYTASVGRWKKYVAFLDRLRAGLAGESTTRNCDSE